MSRCSDADLISRQDAIDALNKKRIETMEKGQDVNLIWECLDVVAQVPSAQTWIPCSKRLPEEKEMVLVTRRSGFVECIFWSSWWYEQNSYLYLKPIAWMPLPEPWKGVADDN